MANLFTLHEQTDSYIRIQKKTQELDIMVEISTEFKPDLRPDTTSDFLDHIVDTLAWGSCLSIGCKVVCGKWRSTHTIAEDVGITIGAGLKKLFYQRLNDHGVNILGWGFGCLDESLVRVVIGTEGRRNTFFSISEDCPGAKTEVVEDLRTADLFGFVEGFFQGYPATCHMDFIKGRDTHHAWESAIHAMGEALRMVLTPNPWRIAKNNPYYGEEGIADASLI